MIVLGVKFLQRKIKLVFIFLLSLLVTGCAKEEVQVNVPSGKSDFSQTTDYGQYSNQENKLRSFIEKKLLIQKGIYTNFKKQSFKEDAARGHELLSESSGMWLEYLVYSHQYKEFREFYKETKKTFDLKTQFSYRYTPSKKKKFPVNATLDDLRIIKALQMYGEATGNKKYKKEAATRFAMLKKNTMSKGKIASFYDTDAKKQSAEGSLAYYDFQVLKYFENTKQGQKMYRQQLAVVQNGYLGDAFPLYASSYNWQSRSYSNADLNTSEAMETLLHLSKINKLQKASFNWLSRQVENNTLYNTYSVNGNIIDRSHSAGSYAIAAMIFANEHDKKMYQKAMELVWKYQVLNKNSDIYGGIGIEHQNEAYSFNNLTTLLAANY